MFFYVNSGALRRYGVKTIPTEKGFDLRIPNDFSAGTFNLSLPIFGEVNLEEDISIEKSKLVGKMDNYKLITTNVKYDNIFYALLHCDKANGDVYIPGEKKNSVKVVHHFSFNDMEVDFGSYTAEFYLIKISLKIGETLPVYFSFKDCHILNDHITFVNSGKKFVVNNLKTYILLKNGKEYVSLGSLM